MVKTIKSGVRAMRAGDWVRAPISPGQYFNREPLLGYARADGQGGNVLHPASRVPDFERRLMDAHRAFCRRHPAAYVRRVHIEMPYWSGPALPHPDDYRLVDAPQSLTTTLVTVVLVPQTAIRQASMGFYFENGDLAPLRERMRGVAFDGVVGNLGYYMTRALIESKFPWSHNRRYPRFPLPPMPSYIGFHLFSDAATGERCGAFLGAHPSAVGVRRDGRVEIVPRLQIDRYDVSLCQRELTVDLIDRADAAGADVALFTPALHTPQVRAHMAAAERSAGRDDGWQHYAPMLPLADAPDRVNVFVANRGDGRAPVERVAAVWEGKAPLPSFGAVLSFKRSYFESVFGRVAQFRAQCVGQPVRITPHGAAIARFAQMLGGLVPAVVDGRHIYCLDTVAQVMQNLGRYGNATSPIAQAGRETKNFDPFVREPAGLLVQTRDRIGWVLFDGRHELSIGAGVVDAGAILFKLEQLGMLGPQRVEQAVFIDGGSAMKVYAVQSDEQALRLDLLNRVAAGSRNGAGSDEDGLNLYTLLTLDLRFPDAGQPDGGYG